MTQVLLIEHNHSLIKFCFVVIWNIMSVRSMEKSNNVTFCMFMSTVISVVYVGCRVSAPSERIQRKLTANNLKCLQSLAFQTYFPTQYFPSFLSSSFCFRANSNVHLASNLQELIIWVIIVCFGEFKLPELWVNFNFSISMQNSC